MKIQNKGKLQQIAFNLSSDTEFQGFVNLYKNVLQKTHSFLLIDTNLASENPSSFRNNILETI